MRSTPPPLYRPSALSAYGALLLLYSLTGLLMVALLAGCVSPTVTSNGKPVTNQALVTATQVVHTSEMAIVTITDALTMAYQAGQVSYEVIDQYQAHMAPKIKAALATAKVALQAWASSPGQSAEATAVQAMIGLAQELDALKGFWQAKKLLTVGGTP